MRKLNPRIVLFSIIILLLTFSIGQADAYKTLYVWPTQVNAGVTYSIEPNISANLGVTNATSAIGTAAATWDNAGVFRFIDSVSWNPNGNTIRTQNFATTPFYGVGDTTAAAVNPFLRTLPSGERVLARLDMAYNVSGKYKFNTVDNVSFTDRDVQRTTTHEFGHWLTLGDNPVDTTATMYSSQRVLSEDDKQGIAQLYGPYTGFDSGRAEGIPSRSTYFANVSGWCCGYGFEASVVGSEVGVTPIYGNRMFRIAGTADATISYVFFKVFSIDSDTGNDIGTTIPYDSRLKWCQYNYQQSTMSLDAYLDDGTSMRQYTSLVDQNGVRIGAQNRNYPTGAWYCFDVNLSPIAGKKVLHWYIAYENRSTSLTGQFRGYFDDVKLVRPGGKQ